MRKAILTMLLSFVSVSAWADWEKVTETDSIVQYIDPTTIRKNGSLRRVWTLTDMKVRDPVGALSLRGLAEFDCKEERMKTLSLSSHSGPMATGQTLSDFEPEGKGSYIAPRTVDEAVLRRVCSR